ncbi:MAG: hypothetical protein ACXAD7_07975 [Candidatus Kariarchaeaceae archaeon]
MENSLKRGFNPKYNIYAIYINTDNNRALSQFLDFELYYIGSTRMDTASGRLLTNHNSLQAALEENYGSVFIALGEWSEFKFSSLKDANETTRTVEAALIYELLPTKNILSTKKYDGPSLTIHNMVRSYCGINLQVLWETGLVRQIDDIGFSLHALEIIGNFIDANVTVVPSEGIQTLMSIVDRKLITIQSTVNIDGKT